MSLREGRYLTKKLKHFLAGKIKGKDQLLKKIVKYTICKTRLSSDVPPDSWRLRARSGQCFTRAGN